MIFYRQSRVHSVIVETLRATSPRLRLPFRCRDVARYVSTGPATVPKRPAAPQNIDKKTRIL